MNTVSGRIVVTTWRAGDRAAPGLARRPVAVGDAELLGEARVELEPRLGVLLDERADAARLRAREELADDAAGRQEERVLLATRRRPAGRYSATLKRALPSGK